MEITYDEIASNLKIVDHLNSNTFKPFHKEHETPNYINYDSNHPYAIVKQIPITVSSRISELSSNKNIFNKNKELYENALHKCGFKNKLSYLNPISNTEVYNMSCKHKNRKII